MELTEVVENVLAGMQQVVSHDGTGQYQATSESTSVGTSACGLATLNCARGVFRLYQDLDDHSCCGTGETDSEVVHDKDRCLLCRCLSRQATEDVMAICSSWTTNAHLDVEEILALPIFKHAFDLVQTTYGQINHKTFWKLLQQMVTIEGVAAAVITRPPEILLCFKMSVSRQTIFIVFDSHPRPSHPNGSGFTLNSTIEATAACLNDLLSIDSGILSDPLLFWQAQTLGHFSAHILVPRTDVHRDPQIDMILMDATTNMLQLMVNLAELKSQEVNLIDQNKDLTNQLNQLERSRLQISAKGKSRAAETYPQDSNPSNSYHALENTSGLIPGGNPSRMLDSSEELAQYLQARFDEESDKLASERQRLQRRQKVFECGVCFETFVQDFVARVKGCKHNFCRDCLRQHATIAIEDRRYPIPCPACLADNSRRPMNINDELLQTLGISNPTYAIFQELQLAAHSISLHCRRCNQTMFVDKAEYLSMEIIVCPLRGCDHVWCKKCERSIQRSVGHSCDGSSELEHLAKASGWRHCPGCQTVIQKASGCNHMTCVSPSCNTHFCYVCGELITRSEVKTDIRQAVAAHYRQCKIFETATT